MSICEEEITWEYALSILEDNALEKLYRNKDTIYRYHAFKSQCTSEGLSVVQFIVKNRLLWVNDEGTIDLTPNTTDELFMDSLDVKVIGNDFPYNFTSNITHLVVWTKLEIPSDPSSVIGDVSERTRAIIDAYIKKSFVHGLGLPEEDVVWFRNFPALQSVVELSHVHVLIKDMSNEQLEEVLGSSGRVLTREDIISSLRFY